MKTKVLVTSIIIVLVLTCSKTLGEMLLPDGSKCADQPPVLKHPREMGLMNSIKSPKTEILGSFGILLDGTNTAEWSRENIGKRQIRYFNPLARVAIRGEGGGQRTYYVPSNVITSYLPDTKEEYQYGEGKVIKETEPNQVVTLSRHDMAVARFFSDSTVVVYAVVRNGKWIASYVDIGTRGVVRDLMEPYVPVETAIAILAGKEVEVDYGEKGQVLSIHQSSKSTSTSPSPVKEANKPITSNNDGLPQKAVEKETQTAPKDVQALLAKLEKAYREGDRQLFNDCFADDFFGTYTDQDGHKQEYARGQWESQCSQHDPELEILKIKQLGPKTTVVYFFISGPPKLTSNDLKAVATGPPQPLYALDGQRVPVAKVSPNRCWHLLNGFKAEESNGNWKFTEWLYGLYGGERKKSQSNKQTIEPEKVKRFNELMSYARARRNREQASEATRALKEALVLHPDNGEALLLRKELENYHSQRPGDIITNSIDMTLVYIPPGEFMMGSNLSPYTGEQPQHKVKLTKGFWMGIYEVTQGQYQEIVGTNPSKFKGDENLPVENVSWDDAMEFCKKLSQKEGKTFSLPTEAQWEYACRAGTSTAYYFGDSENQLDDYAWYGNEKAGKQTHPVGKKKPNAFGLYDMHGNVFEWCLDWYDTNYYSNSPNVDPQGFGSGTWRVLRGGSWEEHDPSRCCSAYRGARPPGDPISSGGLGFRVVSEQQTYSSQETTQADSLQALLARLEKAFIEGDRKLYSDCFADEFFGAYIAKYPDRPFKKEYHRDSWINISQRDPEIEIFKTKQLGPKDVIIYLYVSMGKRETNPEVIDMHMNQPPHQMIDGESVVVAKMSPNMCIYFLYGFKAMELRGKWQFTECVYDGNPLVKSN